MVTIFDIVTKIFKNVVSSIKFKGYQDMVHPIIEEQRQKRSQLEHRLRADYQQAKADEEAARARYEKFTDEDKVLRAELKKILKNFNESEFEQAYYFTRALTCPGYDNAPHKKTLSAEAMKGMMHTANKRALQRDCYSTCNTLHTLYYSTAFLAGYFMPLTITAAVCVFVGLLVLGIALISYTKSLNEALPKKIESETINMLNRYNLFASLHASKKPEVRDHGLETTMPPPQPSAPYMDY